MPGNRRKHHEKPVLHLELVRMFISLVCNVMDREYNYQVQICKTKIDSNLLTH